jgi:alpha-L-rhamnosidase
VVGHINRREFLIASGTAVALPSSTALVSAASAVQIRRLSVDYVENPVGLENVRPQLSWQLDSSARHVVQKAYRILVASDVTRLKAGRADLWDSGKVQSSRSFGIRYEGRPLLSRQRCWWCVQAWSREGDVSEFSEPGHWEMGLLARSDWIAQWIAAETDLDRADRESGLTWIWAPGVEDTRLRQFRGVFNLPARCPRAEFFAAARADYVKGRISRIWIDGNLLQATEGADNLTGRRFQLESIAQGRHLVAMEVESRPPDSDNPRVLGLTAFARCELQNGQTVRIGSDSSWKTATAARDGWHTPQFYDGDWQDVEVLKLDVQPWPPRPAMYLRKEFSLSQSVRQARLYVTALGAYEARLNGVRVGDALLTPEISQYAKHVHYQIYNVTDMLRAGSNALGLHVGDGWYAGFDGRFAWGPPPRRAIAQLEITLADGSGEVIASSPDWRTAESPVRESEIRAGELRDNRLEQPGWDASGFDSSRWQNARVIETPGVGLITHIGPPIRATQELEPKAITRKPNGEYLVDFGQNFAGWCRFHVRGAGGARVELRFGEILTAQGTLEQARLSVGDPKLDTFILRGDPQGETLEPRFAYRGFRYVQIGGITEPPTPGSIRGICVHSDLPRTGTFDSDVPLLQKILRNVLWSQRSNFVGIPTDCPSREQRGWLGDAGAFWDAGAFNMDVCAFTSRYMKSVVDDQAVDGAFLQLVPSPAGFRMGASPISGGSVPGWADAGVILPWTTWQRYGDLGIVERNWEPMRRYLQFIMDHNPDYLWKKKRSADYGDWLSVDFQQFKSNDTTSRDLIATAYWARSASLLSAMAQALGRNEDAAGLQRVFTRVRNAFIRAFVKADGSVDNSSQTANILALKFDLLPEPLRQGAADRLAADIRSRGNALSTGVIGTQFILDVLADTGRPELAYGLLLRTAYPSWGHMVQRGATTIWETWSGEVEFDGNVTRASQNHYAFGAVAGFLFRRVAGIDAAAPGFGKILIRPVMDPRVTRCGGRYDSTMGRISTDWVNAPGEAFTLNVTIPANTTADVCLPVRGRGSRILESDTVLSGRGELQVSYRGDREAIVPVGSGRYRFKVIG